MFHFSKSQAPDFTNRATHVHPLGIHGLEARATLTGSRGTGFQPVKPPGLSRCVVMAE
jgi:hypothetical protein